MNVLCQIFVQYSQRKTHYYLMLILYYVFRVGPNSTEYIIPEKNKYRGVFELSSGPRA